MRFSGRWAQTKRYLARHPILCLLLLTPGIPEYLSGSTSLALLVLNPAFFAIQLAFNLGLYGPGVLLIREAMIRWKKGWATILLLAAAYGILEEGVTLSTLFDPSAPPVILAYYGHWMGVNWVWSFEIILVHMLYSIALPILLLGLALPETRGKSLLTERHIRYVLSIWGADLLIGIIVVGYTEHFWAAPTLLVGSFAVIGILVFLGYHVRADLFSARAPRPARSPFAFALVGISFFPATLLVEGITNQRTPPLVTIGLLLLVAVLWLYWVLRYSGKVGSERCWTALAAGALVPMAVFGWLSGFRIPVIALASVVAGWFLWHTWVKYAGIALSPPPPLPPAPHPSQ